MKGLLLMAALLAGQGLAASATATLLGPQGEARGTATFTEVPGGLRLQVRATGLTPGRHGLHVHENGTCTPGVDKATNTVVPFGGAGEHFDPGMSGNHATPMTPDTQGHGGDLPVLTADASGTATLDFTTRKLTLGGMTGVLHRSLVVHALPDDYKTDPAGQSGARIACGTIGRAGEAARRYALDDPQAFPEGVAVDAKRGLIFTGSSRNGSIYAVNAQTGAVSTFSPGGAVGRTSALGLKLDGQGRLWVAGGSTGAVSVLTPDGAPLTTLMTPPSPQSYLNDLVLGPDGSAYVTDSSRPMIWRVTPDLKRVEPWRPLEGTPIRYGRGINLNGIALSADGRALYTIQYNTGRLYRIELASRAIREVRLTRPLLYGDGLLLDGHTLYVSQNRENSVTKLALSADGLSAQVAGQTSADGLFYPSTLALLEGDLIAVNSQLDRRTSGALPEVPFTLSRFPKF